MTCDTIIVASLVYYTFPPSLPPSHIPYRLNIGVSAGVRDLPGMGPQLHPLL